MVVTLTSFVLFNIHAKKLIRRSNLFFFELLYVDIKKLNILTNSKQNFDLTIIILANQIGVLSRSGWARAHIKTELFTRVSNIDHELLWLREQLLWKIFREFTLAIELDGKVDKVHSELNTLPSSYVGPDAFTRMISFDKLNVTFIRRWIRNHSIILILLTNCNLSTVPMSV